MIFVANWKMNLSPEESKKLALAYKEAALPGRHEVIILASDLALYSVADLLKDHPAIKVYAQDISIFNGYGSYTGEVSARQVADAGGQGCLLGHMERRTHLSENDNEINLKMKNALNAGLKVILSVGVTSAELDAESQHQLMEYQLRQDLYEITAEQIAGKLTIAFESVALISSYGNLSGTELPATDIFDRINFIREWLARVYPGVAVPVIYGGSVGPENIRQFTTEAGKGCDGFLVGKKSLDLVAFKNLLEAV